MTRDNAARPTPVILCADDFGIAPGVSAAIRDLLERDRLSATSCMTASPFWAEEAAPLRRFADRADLGLHLTLTDQVPLGPMPHTAPAGRLPRLATLIRYALLGALDRAEVAAELDRQFDRFESALGRPPAYLDGHQHVHQIPVVRDIVIELFRRRLAGRDAYVRYCDEPVGAILGRRVHALEAIGVSLLGRRFARRGRRAGIPGNRRFAGVHDFAGRTPYDQLFRAFLDGAEPGLLVMCHPGLSDAALAAADPVTTAREEEYRFFLSDAFPALLRQRGIVLSRFAGLDRARAAG